PYFRLLRIKPGSPDDVIQCILESRPMYEGLSSYKALSYSWGDEPFSETIYIGRNSLQFSVSPHVAAALRHLRDPCRAVHVWIDAICINQGDLLEKSQQLSIMASIYNQAEQVVIWLGGNGDSNNQSLEDEEVIWSMCQQSHAWWNRLWVVQECVYAERCPVVMLGDHTMSLDSWIQTWTASYRSWRTRDGDSLNRTKILQDNLVFLRMPYDAWKTHTEDNIQRLPLLLRLRQTAERQCKVPHDRIYAILSIVDHREARWIPPDYRKSYSTLRTEVNKILRSSP
ncbi:HET-domain-containing protein, partial [Dissoconium aciculare CBS 342.82]|uniref:HET-domain-containing protein n=1 Tax=Dissoconium aciculare CBS 342.82 TaxID=1314786 RepID=A0A6J3MCY9_9PEZI